ncbi:MAG: glycosyltransferase family 39 protein [Elusimicrobia bacterium]|nr:glycosyltransferase family 39 protein [Elusimicrobiota bacterium]
MTKKKEHPVNFVCRLPVFLCMAVLFVWGYSVIVNYYRVYPANFSSQYLSWIFSLPHGSQAFNVGRFVSAWLKYLLDFVLLSIFLLSARGAGVFIFRNILGMNFSDNIEETVFSTGLGLGVVIMFNILLGFTGMFYGPAVAVVYLAGLSGNLFARKAVPPSQQAPGRVDVRAGRMVSQPAAQAGQVAALSSFDFVLIALIVIALSVTLAGSLTPETFYDSLKYHVALPYRWVRSHTIQPLEHFTMSYYPFNLHTLYANALFVGDDILAKLIHFAFGVLSVLTLYAMGKKYFSARTGLLAGVIFYTAPIVLLVSWKTAIELGLTFFELLAVFSVLIYSENNTHRRQWLVLSGVFCGLAVGSKSTSMYCMLAIAVILFLRDAFLTGTEGNAAGVKGKNMHAGVEPGAVGMDALCRPALSSVIFLAVALLVASPWYVRTGVLTGNPTYPTFISLPVKGDFMHHINKGVIVDVNDPGVPDRGIKNFLTLPWSMTMGKKTQEPYSGALFLLFIPFVFLVGKTPRPAKLLVVYFFLYYVVWFTFRTYLRYFVPAFAVGGLVFSIYVTRSGFAGWFKKIVLTTVVIMAFTNLLFVAVIQKPSMEPLGVMSGAQARDAYLSTQRQGYPCPYYPVVPWANKNLPANAKVMFLGECRTYYLKRDVVAGTIADINPVIQACSQAKDSDDIRKILAREKITHILFNLPEARRLAGYDMLHWEGPDLVIFNEFWKKYVKEVHRGIADVTLQDGRFGSMVPEFWTNYIRDPRNYVYIYKIMDEQEAKSARAVPAPVNYLHWQGIYTGERFKKIEPFLQ